MPGYMLSRGGKRRGLYGSDGEIKIEGMEGNEELKKSLSEDTENKEGSHAERGQRSTRLATA